MNKRNIFGYTNKCKKRKMCFIKNYMRVDIDFPIGYIHTLVSFVIGWITHKNTRYGPRFEFIRSISSDEGITQAPKGS